MTKIDGNCLTTNEVSVAALFLGKFIGLQDESGEVHENMRLCDVSRYRDKPAFLSLLGEYSVCYIPCALVCEVVRQPIINRAEGGEFWFPKITSEEWPDSDPPEYSWRVTTNQNPNYYYIADNAITAGRNTGDLRKLVQWIIGSVVQGTTQKEPCDNVLGEQGSKEKGRRWTVTHRDSGERRG